MVTLSGSCGMIERRNNCSCRVALPNCSTRKCTLSIFEHDVTQYTAKSWLTSRMR